MGRFDHIGVTPGACFTCHNGSSAKGKPGNHAPTTLSCDACHRTTTWRFATFTHMGIAPGTCMTCHNGATAKGRPQSHMVTVRSCDTCHRTTGWRPALPYRHDSPMYRQHNAGATCRDCHSTNTETIAYKGAAYKPDCAACHVTDFRPSAHRKADAPGAFYTVGELKDCTGACHEYTDATFTRIRKARSGHHRPTDGSF